MIREGNIRDTSDLQILIDGCERVRVKGREKWQVSDIIAAIYAGNASFCIGTDDDMFVYYLKTEYDEKIAWIWVSSIKGHRLESYMSQFKEFIKNLNCSSIMWSSKRIGWTKKFRVMNSNIHQIEYKIAL